MKNISNNSGRALIYAYMYIIYFRMARRYITIIVLYTAAKHGESITILYYYNL